MRNMSSEDDDFVMNLWEEIPFEPSKFEIMPTRFKYVLTYFSNIDTLPSNEQELEDAYELALQQWPEMESEYGLLEDEDESFCICSHIIQRLFYVSNSDNDNRLRVGSCCIKKFGSEENKENLRLLSKQMKYKGKKRLCESCGNYRISKKAPSWHRRCKSCFGNDNSFIKIPIPGGRICSSCKGPYIQSNEPSWKTKCTDCYKATGYRNCELCGRNKIKEDSPGWMKLCRECYRK